MTPAQALAYAAVARGRRLGTIVSEPCAECGYPKTYGHHRWGYEGENALRLVWLCSLHHSIEHSQMRATATTGLNLRSQRLAARVNQADLASKMGLGRTRVPQIEAQAEVSDKVTKAYMAALVELAAEAKASAA